MLRCIFAETSHHCVKYMRLSLRKIIFNSVKFYSWYCKMFGGSLFSGHSVEPQLWEKTKIFFLNFRIVAGSLPYNSINLGIKISHGSREIAFCLVGYFNLSHPVVIYLDYH